MQDPPHGKVCLHLNYHKDSLKKLDSGLSGCTLSLENDGAGGGLFIRKTCQAPYAARLKKQAEKQRLFAEKWSILSFGSPGIMGDFDEENHSFCMQYIGGTGLANHIVGSFEEVNRFTEAFLFYINHLLTQTEGELEINEILLAKLYEIEVFCSEHRPYILAFIGIRESLRKVRLRIGQNSLAVPLGFCHGDFTLSNILVDEHGRYILVDFLDSFIETPLMDLAKLRQDILSLWSAQRVDNPVEGLSLAIACRAVNRIITGTDCFRKYEKEISILEVIALLRILPYASYKDACLLNHILTRRGLIL